MAKTYPRSFALVMAGEPLPGPEERNLIGYFELAPSAERGNVQMDREDRQHVAPDVRKPRLGSVLAFLLVAACVMSGFQTVKPGNSVLDRLQDSATPAPLDRPSPPREQRQAKVAMVQWLEQYLHEKYRVTVIDQRFVLTAPGFTDGARIRSKANQYVEQKLGGVAQPVVWYEDEYFFPIMMLKKAIGLCCGS